MAGVPPWTIGERSRIESGIMAPQDTRSRERLARRPGRRRPALLDLVLDRRDALEELRDRLEVGPGQVLLAGQRSLDVLAHEAAGHVAVGPVAAGEVGHDLLLAPAADPGVLVGRDVRRRLPFGPGSLRVAREQARVVDGHGERRARRVALAAMAYRAHEILAARHPRGGRRRRWDLP